VKVVVADCGEPPPTEPPGDEMTSPPTRMSSE